MRLWLLLRRRRRLLTLIVTSGVAFLLVSSFGLPGNMGQNVVDAFDNSDYDLNYDSVDAVHAMVRQMSSVKRRTQLQVEEEQEQSEPTAAEEKDTYLKFEPLDPRAHQGHQKKKIRLGIGDYPDIPDDVPKKYSFIHQQQKTTVANTRGPPQEADMEQNQLKYERLDGQFEAPVAKNRMEERIRKNRVLDDRDKIDNAEEEDSYEADYKEDENEENIIEVKEDESYEQEDEEYDYANPNPMFKQEDFDPMPANASKKRTFQFENLADEDQQNRLHYEEDDGVNYEDNDPNNNDDDYVAQHDTHVNGRMLHSKLSGVSDDDLKETGGHNQRDVHDNHKTLTSDITRLHTPIKRQQNIGVRGNQRHLPLDMRMSNSHHGYRSNTIRQQDNVPNVVVKFKQNLPQNVIQTPPVTKSDWNPQVKVVRLPDHPGDLPATQIQTPRLPRQLGPVVYSNDGYPLVEDSIFWSQKVESFVPKGLSDSDVQSFKHRVSHLPVSEMHSPKWNRCGRAKNQYVVLSDGTAMCARYRDPHNKLIYGEALSFYLSRMLGLDAVPAVALTKVNSSAPQWQGQDIVQAQWHDGRTVAMIQWIEGLDMERSRVKMPAIMLNAYDTGSSLDRHHPAILAMTPAELSELVQWSDMVLFDYITGHYDRFASMQDGADREHRPSILAESVRNLRKVPETGKMWLIDNESGLFDAYELLYRGRTDGQKFIKFHQRMLKTFCIYRQSTVERILQLAAHSSPDDLLLKLAHKAELLLEQMPRTAEYKLFKGYFHTRLKEVRNWIETCRKSH